MKLGANDCHKLNRWSETSFFKEAGLRPAAKHLIWYLSTVLGGVSLPLVNHAVEIDTGFMRFRNLSGTPQHANEQL